MKRLEFPTADKDARPGLWASFVASYARLSDDEAAALRAFGALWAPTGTPYVIGRVAMLKNEDLAEEVLRRLARRSLMKREKTDDGVTRYRAHDLTRDFALALLRERAELPDAQERALNACVAYAQRYAERDRAAYDRLDAELDNLLSSAQWAKDHQKWEAVNHLALDLWGIMDIRGREVSNLLLSGLEAARVLGNRFDEATHLNNLGLAYFNVGLIDSAIDRHQDAFRVAQSDGGSAPAIRGRSLGNLGRDYAALGNYELAIDYYNKALDAAIDIADILSECNWYGHLGLAHAALGDFEEAVEYYELALSTVEKGSEYAHQRLKGTWLVALGEAYDRLGKFNEADICYESALPIVRFQIGDLRATGKCLGNMGLHYELQGDLNRAEGYYNRALDIHRGIGEKHAVALWLHNLGDVMKARTDRTVGTEAAALLRQAVAYYEEALAIRREIKDPRAEDTAAALEAARGPAGGSGGAGVRVASGRAA
ncbi:MAG: tetratricopeptide repeat protein [Anaerolineae bacterium]|nr:tetratricopeptide repeat protein [Anaerolineae bacterium]